MGISEGLPEHYPDLPEAKIWFRGRMKIDGVWISKEMEIESCGILPLGFGIG